MYTFYKKRYLHIYTNAHKYFIITLFINTFVSIYVFSYMKEIKTNDGKKGGWLVGKRHYDKSGKCLGGIKAVVTDAGGKPVELEGGEVIINREASKKYWKELSRINQSAGNGVAIGPPSGFDEDPEDNYENGGKIDFNPNHIPNKWILFQALFSLVHGPSHQRPRSHGGHQGHDYQGYKEFLGNESIF
jgi:hypothetical protein